MPSERSSTRSSRSEFCQTTRPCTWSSITVSPVSGALQADHRLDAGRRLGRVAVAPAPVIELGAALAAGRLAHLGEFLRAGVAAIGLAGGEQLLGDLAVARGARELEDDLAVPGEPQPGQAVEDGGDGGGGRALAVGVLDAQQHLAAVPARIEPVEQRGAAAADMEEAGGRGRKAGDDGLGHRAPCTTVAGKGVSAIDIEPSATSWHRPPAVEAAS